MDVLKPSNIKWPHITDGVTTDVYDFGNGYGAVNVHGSFESLQTGPTGDLEQVVVVKNELHPLELPRFREPVINYLISPEIPVTGDTLQAELNKLKATTDA